MWQPYQGRDDVIKTYSDLGFKTLFIDYSNLQINSDNMKMHIAKYKSNLRAYVTVLLKDGFRSPKCTVVENNL